MCPYADLYSQDADIESQPGDIVTVSHDLDGDGRIDELSTSDPNDAPLIPEPNENPFARRIANRERGLIRWLINKLGMAKREPTMADIAEMSDAQRMKLLEKTLREEAQVCSGRISNALDRMGFSHRRYSNEGELKKKAIITFDIVLSTEDAHWLHVNMDRLPYGVNSSAIIDQRVLDDLGKSVGHKVNLRATDEAGIWYVVERASGMMGIPTHVSITDMWARFPPSANGLTIPMGMGTNRKLIYEDIDTMVHGLFAGETGGGKSNAQNVFIATLASRNTPQQLQLMLLDMKAGLEFQYYENLPHLVNIPDVSESGIIEHPDKVFPAFKWLIDHEAPKRMAVIRASGHRSISDYNARRKNKMPRLMVMCDEWGIARLGDKGKEAENELAKSVMLLRAVGIHIYIGTQTPTKEVLGLLVRSNLPTKICFNCNELSASSIVVGDSSAMGLPVGRCIFKHGMSKIAVQMPYISTEMIKASLKPKAAGDETSQLNKSGHDVELHEILHFGMDALAGTLPHREIFKHFQSRGITDTQVRQLLNKLDSTQVELDGKTYMIEPGAGSKPRRIVSVKDET